MKTEDLPMGDLDEPPGTILVGSMNKRAYLFLSQSAERMVYERQQARSQGVQDMREFVFVFDGQRVVLTYEELKERLLAVRTSVASEAAVE